MVTIDDRTGLSMLSYDTISVDHRGYNIQVVPWKGNRSARLYVRLAAAKTI
jgi:hypothetical protein